MHDFGCPVLGDRGLKHVNGKMVGFTFLDPVANDLTRVNIGDLVGLEYNRASRGKQIGDIPGPCLAGPGR